MDTHDENVNIGVNLLTKNPDKCFGEEERSGRYRNLVRQEAKDLINNNDNTVRFVCISDTHSETEGLETTLPAGDVLIHAGDFTKTSAESEIIAFNDFLGKVKNRFKHIVVIAGNHELSFDERSHDRGGLKISLFKLYYAQSPFNQQLNPVQSKQLLTNCTYLEEEAIELYGIKIYGSPWQPSHYDLAFNGVRGEDLLEKWQKIPQDTDILVTHGPPLGIGDKIVRGNRVGCAELLTTVMDRVLPKYHIFGHIHEDYGIWNDGKTTFINASTCNKKYLPVNPPVVFDFKISEDATNESS